MTGNTIESRLEQVRSTLPPDVTLVAISKYHHPNDIRAAYLAGQRVFGESREQELALKHSTLPADISWHFIGHLQTNKVRLIAPFISCIQSVDSERLLSEINKRAAQNNRVIDILLEVHVAAETTKSGFAPSDLYKFLDSDLWKGMNAIRIRGIMGMATNTDDTATIHADFQTLRQIYDHLKDKYFNSYPHFDTLSMGMSHDYPIALQHGSNMVRVGTAIFGSPLPH
ncbi:MAG: YggS family pyridoxal phosphate-dependent enzyme [Paludibacteraceae bacterium]|nr:YggS family pyridoxal phosphate-dependent enzyme [Paludibacteraceae bacterium]